MYAGAAVELLVHLDSLGVEVISEVPISAIQGIVDPLGLTVSRRIGTHLFVLGLAGPVTVDSLTALARQVIAAGTGVALRAGLVVRLDDWPEPSFVSDEFIVQFRPDVAMDEINLLNQSNGVEVVRAPRLLPNNFVLRVTPASPAPSLAMSRTYHDSPLTEFAHPNFIRVPLSTSVSVGDPLFAQQWHLENNGQTGGLKDADIDAPEAWTLETGKPDVLIAVLETFGFDTTHVDLKANLWLNPGEAVDGADDADPLGKPDDMRGWNFSGCPGAPDCGSHHLFLPGFSAHGTAVSGIAAAVTDNLTGVAGVCPGCSFMPVIIGTTDDAAAAAMEYAAAMGAKIINNSWSTWPVDQIRKQVQITAANGVTVVWAACYPWFCPSLCNAVPERLEALDSVITVSQTDHNDVAIPFTNHPSINGSCLDLVAPGMLIGTTDVMGNDGYNNQSPSSACADAAGTDKDYTLCFGGTSAAAPIVAGVAGLLLSANPGLTREQVQDILEKTADHVDIANSNAVGKWIDTDGDGVVDFSNWYGHGRVNAFTALSGASATPKSGSAGAPARFEVGVRAGVTAIDGPPDKNTANAPGGGPGGQPAFHLDAFLGSFMLELQFGYSRTDVSGGTDETNAVAAFQPAYLFTLGGGKLYAGPSLGYEVVDIAGASTSDWSLGPAIGYRLMPRPFLALRIEGRYRYWFDRNLNEFGLAAGFGVVLQ